MLVSCGVKCHLIFCLCPSTQCSWISFAPRPSVGDQVLGCKTTSPPPKPAANRTTELLLTRVLDSNPGAGSKALSLFHHHYRYFREKKGTRKCCPQKEE
ncbi:hypothetical protein QBC44DRAFT_26613 [Cladorrhinum sp. PSN332]|nr:hypothetical protein QBC44DRAFT_26613 [Cladorrhinum sp. PSN332]